MTPIGLDFARAGQRARAFHVDVASGDLHRRLGGYPGPGHVMPNCCQVMRRLMTAGDRVLAGRRVARRDARDPLQAAALTKASIIV